jgi:hypothetical protein
MGGNVRGGGSAQHASITRKNDAAIGGYHGAEPALSHPPNTTARDASARDYVSLAIEVHAHSVVIPRGERSI